MGTLKKLAEYLSGGGGRKKNVNLTSAISKIRILGRRLRRQSNRLNIKAKNLKQKAKEALRRGDKDAAVMYIRSSIQNQRWAKGLDNFRIQLEGLQVKLESAKNMEEVSGILRNVAGTIGSMKEIVNLNDFQALLEKVDEGMIKIDDMHEMTMEGLEGLNMESEVPDDEVLKVMDELNAEIGIDTSTSLPTSPAAVEDEELKNLEKELERLKNQK